MRIALSLLLLVNFVIGNEKTIPEAKLKDLKNIPQSTGELTAGKITLINFWATYCVPCRKEMKHLDRINKTYTKDGVQVIGVSIDDPRTVGRVTSVIHSQKLEYKILLDTDKSLYRNFNTNAMPFSILVDGEGKILWEHTGYIPGDEIKMEQEIKKAISARNTTN
jgi:thiol-disulfide isomerase/thioredoxin